MVQQEINFNRLPSPKKLFETDCQDRQLYEYFLLHPNGVPNYAIRDDLKFLSHSKRISAVRAKLKPFGWTIEKEWKGNGVFVYRIVRI
jgi:hypothetical protein